MKILADGILARDSYDFIYIPDFACDSDVFPTDASFRTKPTLLQNRLQRVDGLTGTSRK
jgi:hypothetical protein